MSVFSLIQSPINDSQTSVYNDVVFVIDTSSSLSPWFTLLLDEYIVKIIRYFTGFIGNPKDFYESKVSSLLTVFIPLLLHSF
ncbi:hypothetical protein LOD99_5113 [Oopsacas minuta]|uniref:Mediator of RNA polymerase II transcription subunit 25 von Willebrand factor type A domain-containing protein n=1 Tax=Oopsacas minuta TaxID=111878 RepID=A0AAV7JSV5_9METZ|nr:hypothetical protein LOD99_5113 [Oopsacas minuta]